MLTESGFVTGSRDTIAGTGRVLVATGIYLALFFDPSEHLTKYEGSYAPMHGREVSSAYASTVSLSFDVRAGLLVRQTHHWAAHVFIGASCCTCAASTSPACSASPAS